MKNVRPTFEAASKLTGWLSAEDPPPHAQSHRLLACSSTTDAYPPIHRRIDPSATALALVISTRLENQPILFPRHRSMLRYMYTLQPCLAARSDEGASASLRSPEFDGVPIARFGILKGAACIFFN